MRSFSFIALTCREDSISFIWSAGKGLSFFCGGAKAQEDNKKIGKRQEARGKRRK
jgi:hypothetical protein